MKNSNKATNRIKYLLKNKIIKNIKNSAMKYSPSDMKEDLNEIHVFFKERGLYDSARIVNSIIAMINHIDFYKEAIMKELLEVEFSLDLILEKQKIMDLRETEKRRDHVEYVNRMARKKKEKETIEKYDIVHIPTQGGLHDSVVYDFLENGIIICYPITTASGRDLRLLGNRWYTLRNCGCPRYDGCQLSSAAAYVSLERASYCKKAHVSNHEEIDTAVASF